jgi:hypothetical protein
MYAPHKGKRKDSGVTRVRINESGMLVRSVVVRGRLTMSMKCLGHEALRGHVPHHRCDNQLESRDAKRPS